MPRLMHQMLFYCAVLLQFAGVVIADDSSIDAATASQLFAAPPREYATAPLWVWNDMLTDEQIRGTMRDLAAQKVMQVFVHPRPGLMTPYLSDEWFRLWNVALDEAEKLDMNVWIYDENSYPSGFAGGHVPELMPESRGRGLAFREQADAPQVRPDVLAVYQITPDGAKDVTSQLRAGEKLASGKFLVASVVRAGNSPWHGDRCYVDLMYPGVTEKFLEVTLDAYKEHVGHQFGKRVLGSFTDEPNVAPAGGLPWTDHLPQAFQERWGYNLLENLASLNRPVGNWKQVRHDYFQVVMEQYIEHWAKPYYTWCEQNGIAFTGHYWDHEWPNTIGVPDNMALSAWQHMPGIDCLMNQYSEQTHGQFGNVRFVKEVQSLCNQLGRERYLCEIYGAGGWDLRFEDMKRIADWLGVLGVNLFDEHLSYITLRGARKADHPQSFSYHEPWWDSYHVMAEYITRLSVAMSVGRQRNHVLVIEPTTTAWMYQGASDPAGRLGEIGKTFFDLVYDLEQAQVESDLGCENVIAQHGSVRPGTGSADPGLLVVGQGEYHTVVLPPWCETLRGETMKLLEEFAAAGGQIISCGPPPALIDGRPSDRGANLARRGGWQQVDVQEAVKRLAPSLDRDRCVIERAEGDQGILFHQRRQLTDGELLLLVNTSIETPAAGIVRSTAQGVQKWDLFSGTTAAYPFARDADVCQIPFELPPCGSLLLFLANTPGEPGASVAPGESTPISASGPLQIRRVEPNVLKLDFVDVTAGGETRERQYYYAANHMVWQKNGLPRNPWDSAVQYKDELISKQFPADSGFEVTYRFTIEGDLPQPLQLVVERADLYAITCNGKPVAATKDAWWLDKAFGVIDISSAAKPGENAVTLKAQPFTMYHEIAAAYVLGEFSLRPASAGFVIVPPQAPAVVTGLAHGSDIEGVAWMSTGVGFQRPASAEEGNDRAPFIAFDLGKPCELSTIEVWNYNEASLPGRGVKKMEVRGSITPDGPDAWSIPLGTFELARAPGGAPGARTAFSEMLPVRSPQVRYVKFVILANHSGTTYPATDVKTDSAFVGLGEVRFHTPAAANRTAPVPDVKVLGVSSELVAENGFDRRAVHVVDGSGLGESAIGWNQQGLPFYAAGVAYRQTFQIQRPDRPVKVRVPQWHGSVAKVLVNDKLCGHLIARPWEVDVTHALKAGENTVEVVIIGTLKNTLGPHHGNPGTGSAWPGMFQQGPADGPPPGSAYHTLGYGLFAPFELVEF